MGVHNVLSRLWLSAMLQMLPVVPWDTQQWQQQQAVLRQLCGSRNLTFQCHGVSLFQQKSMQTKGTLRGEKADVHVQKDWEATGEGMCIFIYTIYACKYVLRHWFFCGPWVKTKALNKLKLLEWLNFKKCRRFVKHKEITMQWFANPFQTIFSRLQ